MNSTFCGKQIADDELANLVATARIGDQDAVSALYEKTYSKVYYTVKSMIKDEDAVFDIVQDTYIKAFSRLDGFQGDTKFLPWVRQIAANTARDWLKKRRPMLRSSTRKRQPVCSGRFSMNCRRISALPSVCSTTKNCR